MIGVRFDDEEVWYYGNGTVEQEAAMRRPVSGCTNDTCKYLRSFIRI